MANPQRTFSTGRLIATSLDVANPTPIEFGILQDVSVSFDYTEKPLYGQYQDPYDVARGERKITGKATAAKISANQFNALFYGATLTPSTGLLLAGSEAHSVPASSTYTVTVTNAGTFIADEGVYYALTGLQLVRVASGPAAGQYSVNVSTGVYTFAAGDASAPLLFNYTYSTVSGSSEVVINNQLMGNRPTFSMILSNVTNSDVFNLQLYKCTSSKLSLSFKQQDWLIPEFDFVAMQNDAGQVALQTTTGA